MLLVRKNSLFRLDVLRLLGSTTLLCGKARFRANFTTFLSYIVAMITEQYGNNIAVVGEE